MQVFKTVAICLVYAPLWPLSYALCAASLLAGCECPAPLQPTASPLMLP